MRYSDLELMIACWDIKELSERYDALILTRQRHADQMSAILEASAYKPLSTEQGLVFDDLSARIREIDEALPNLQMDILATQDAIDILRELVVEEWRQAQDEQRARLDASRERALRRIHLERAPNKPAAPSAVQVNACKPPIFRIQRCGSRPRRWREWGSLVEPVRPVIAVTESDKPDPPRMILADELDRTALTLMSWAPWSRRQRYARSRRYEGFALHDTNLDIDRH